jgi:hypothetical protein
MFKHSPRPVPERPLSLGERLNKLRPLKRPIILGTRNFKRVEISNRPSGKHGPVRTITPAEELPRIEDATLYPLIKKLREDGHV